MTPKELDVLRKLLDDENTSKIFMDANSVRELLEHIDSQDKEIKRLEAHSAIVLSHCDHLKLSVEALESEIKRLEDALVEERARRIITGDGPDADIAEARKQLRAEGAIR